MKLPVPKFDLESIVYPKVCATTDNAIMVTGILYRPGCQPIYLVADAEGDEKERFECELTGELVYNMNNE